MKIVVLGASGMLGHKLVQRLAQRHEVIGTLRASAPDYEAHPAFAGLALVGGIDAHDLGGIERALAEIRPQAVVNCIGIIKQRDEAALPIPTIEINALLPHQLAELSRGIGARFVHFSTDCVFSGDTGHYTEADAPDPPDLYGRTKLIGEVAGPGALTIRSSVIGRELFGSHGLLEWFRTRRGLAASGFQRAIYSGLTTLAMADVVGRVLESHADLEGVWHVASEPISKLELLGTINEALALKVKLSAETGFACDRSLDDTRFREKTGWQPPSWDEMISELAADPTPYP